MGFIKRNNMDLQSLLGYRKDSPYRNNPYIDIHSPEGLIDMSYTDKDLLGIDEYGNRKVMKAGRKRPYKFQGKVIREIPFQKGGWHEQWLNSPMAQKMNQGEEDFTARKLQALSELGEPEAVNPSFIANKSGRKSGNLGMYDENDHKIYYNRKIQNPRLLDKVIQHEKSHATDRGGKLMSAEDLKLTDSEGRALLNQARYQYQQDGVYDPFNQEFKSDYLNNKNDGIRNLRKIYSDEEITNLMNEVSSNNPYKVNNTAQFGGLQGIMDFLYDDEEDDDEDEDDEEESPATAPDNSQVQSYIQTLVASNPINKRYQAAIAAQAKSQGTSKANYAYNYFLSKGLAPHQAAGVVANLIQESGNFRDDVISGQTTGDNNLKNKGYGIAQWRGERYSNLINYAQKQGMNPYTLDAQLAFVEYEAKQRGDWDKLLNTKNLNDATHSFNYNYEVSADSRNPALKYYRTKHVLDKNGNLIFK